MNMSKGKEMRSVPRLPLMVMEKILKYISSTKVRKNCRLVCFNWLYLIDTHVGLGLKLTKANKAKLFASDLLRSCTSLKIFDSAGTVDWYVCYFSPKNLKSVEIVGNILIDNWRLLLGQCLSMQLLTITVHKFNDKLWTYTIKDFSFPDDSATNKINHQSLRRIVFNGISNIENDGLSIKNMISTIGIAPHLRQMIFNFLFIFRIDPDLIPRSLDSLMQRNPALNGIGFLSLINKGDTSYSDMKTWDYLLQQNRNCLVLQCRDSHWIQDMFQRVPVLDELHYEINRRAINVLQQLVADLLRNLQTLSLGADNFKPYPLDCSLLLQLGLQRLTKLSLHIPMWIYLRKTTLYGTFLGRCSLINSNLLSNIQLEYLYISIPVSETNMDDIFRIPTLKEFHIQHQESTVALKKRHFDIAVQHNHLALIYWAKPHQDQWKAFCADSKNDVWKFVTLEEKSWVPILNISEHVTHFTSRTVDSCVALNSTHTDSDEFLRNHAPQSLELK